MTRQHSESLSEDPVRELNRATWRRATSCVSVFRYIRTLRSKPWRAVDQALRAYEAHAWVPKALAGNPFLPSRTELDAEREAREAVAAALRDYAQSFATREKSYPHVDAVVDLVVAVIKVTTWVEQLAPLAQNKVGQHRDAAAARHRMEQRYARSRIQPRECPPIISAQPFPREHGDQ